MISNVDIKGIEVIRKEFEISYENIDKHNTQTTIRIKKYLEDVKSGTMTDDWEKWTYNYYTYLDTDTIDVYAEYGADKAGVRDIKRFLSKFNMTSDYVLEQLSKFKDLDPSTLNYRQREMYERPTFTTPDRELVITISNKNFLKDGCFGYLGVTGKRERVYEFIYYFNRLGFCDASCYGGRDYI
jgi:hypothetical protein